MRRASKVDDNHKDVVARFRFLGFSVQSLAGVGDDCPDLLVARNMRTAVVEVKDGAKVPSKRRMSPGQLKWAEEWKGVHRLVETLADVDKLSNEWMDL